MKIFQVGKEEKCGCCNWKVSKTYLLANSQEEADSFYREMDRGLCADCLVEMMMEEEYEVQKK